MVKIVTDSMCSLPKDRVKEYDITIVPAYVTFDTEALRDGIDLTVDEFYERLVKAKELPTTSQPSVGDFKEVYEEVLKKDAKTILSIHMTGALSGTVESARQAAAKLPDADIRVYDTRSISLGQGLMIIEAARLLRDKTPVDDVIKQLDQMRDDIKYYFALDTLDYLAKGGRIGRAARLMGTVLNMKPVIRFEHGVLEPHDRYRSKERAVEAIRQLVVDDRQPGMKMSVIHSNNEKEAREFAKELSDLLEPDIMMVGDVGPAIGSHIGPGSLGVIWYGPKKKNE